MPSCLVVQIHALNYEPWDVLMHALEISLYNIAHGIALRNERCTYGSWRSAMGYEVGRQLHETQIGMVRVGSVLGQESLRIRRSRIGVFTEGKRGYRVSGVGLGGLKGVLFTKQG